MKARHWFWLAALIGAALVAYPGLKTRWAVERAERSAAFLVDWDEIASWMPLPELADAGVQGIVLSSLTRKDLQFRNGKSRIASSAPLLWRGMDEEEIGYDLPLLRELKRQGFRILLRVVAPSLQDPVLKEADGFIFVSDFFPRKAPELEQWVTFFNAHPQMLNLLMDFKPAKTATALALALPNQTFRTHTLPMLEAKELSPFEEKARWRRALEERRARFLFVRPRPEEPRDAFLQRLAMIRELQTKHGIMNQWPSLSSSPAGNDGRLHWRLVSALGLAIIWPLFGLWGVLQFKTHPPLFRYFLFCLFILVGGGLLAALGTEAHLLKGIVPFRGVKLALIVPWLLAGAFLINRKEALGWLQAPFKRIEVILFALLLAVVGYSVIRSGNAPTQAKWGKEQILRNALEEVMPARPRFKEFAVGYPLLMLGFLLAGKKRSAPYWIWLGMIGPITTLNTFCHWHSPLPEALWRSVLGILIGGLFGLLLFKLGYQRREKPHAS